MQVLWNEFGRNIEILKYSTRNENDNTCLFNDIYYQSDLQLPKTMISE